MDLRAISQSIMLFVVAGLMEIGGGYLVWLWLRESRGWLLGAMGGLLLFLYGVVPTLQPAHFGRVYAAYGGVFVVLSILWGWWVDGVRRSAVRCRCRGDHVLAASREVCARSVDSATENAAHREQ